METVWNVYEEVLKRASLRAYGEIIPEAHLMIAILIQAGKDGDKEYIFGETGKKLAYLAGLNYNKVVKGFELVWSKSDGVQEIEGDLQ